MTSSLENTQSGRIRIVIVTGSLDVGGTERHLSQVLPKLSDAEFEIIVLTLTHKGSLAPLLEEAGVSVLAPEMFAWLKRRRPLRIVFAIVWLIRQLRQQRPYIIHTFLPEAYLTAGLLSVLMRVPVRVMSRRSLNNYQTRRPVAAWIEHRLHRYMTILLGNSAAVVKQLRLEARLGDDRIRLIHNGVDLAPFRLVRQQPDVRQELGIPAEATVFITVANLIPYKGHADEVKAFGLAAKSLPQPWRLLMIGSGNGILDDLRAQADALGLADNILWLGQRTDIPDLLSAADIGVLASHEEGMSNSVLEGMASGLPMIVTDVGGNSELVNNDCGTVVPPHAPAELASALTALADDVVRRQKLAAAARLRIEADFSLAACVSAYRKLYRELVGRHQRGAGQDQG